MMSFDVMPALSTTHTRPTVENHPVQKQLPPVGGVPVPAASHTDHATTPGVVTAGMVVKSMLPVFDSVPDAAAPNAACTRPIDTTFVVPASPGSPLCNWMYGSA